MFLAPPIGYGEALAEMISSDALLILQASNCNDQIPAKLYECLRARRPILGLTDPAGDTAAALRAAGEGRYGDLAEEGCREAHHRGDDDSPDQQPEE